MPATTSVNKLTVVHAGSTGIAMSFPDVCKTPSPAGPIPIPYPNIAQSSDTADGSTTVKVDGNPIMLKSSNFRMSTGDEAGAAMGVVSNKIKGKAIPVNASFDVKVDGKNVFRLTDPMQANCGSNANTFNPAEAQAPNPFTVLQSPECEKTDEKRKEQKSQESKWANSGIIKKHRGPIQQVTDDLKYIVWFRKTKDECGPWIEDFHMPKPHSCMKGTTIKAERADTLRVQAWLDRRTWTDASSVAPGISNLFYSPVAEQYVGIIGLARREETEIEPLKGGGRQLGASYTGKWMTADYDLFQVLRIHKKCSTVKDESFAKLKRAVNSALKWDAIQHPPQAQWIPNPKERRAGVKNVNMPDSVNAVLSGTKGAPRELQVLPAPRKPMRVIDSPLTVVCGKTVVSLETEKEVIDSLKCKRCGE